MQIIEETQKAESSLIVHHKMGNTLKKFYKLCFTFIEIKSNLSSFILRGCLVLEMLQLIAMSFSPFGSNAYEDDLLFSWAESIADCLLIFPFLPKAPLFFLIANAAITLITLIAFGLAIVPFFVKCHSSIFHTISRVAFFIVLACSTFLFIPLLGILAISLKCTKEINWVLYIDHTTTCFGSTHSPIAILAFTGWIGLFIVALIFKLFIFSFELNNKDPTAKLDSTSDLIFHIVRTLEITLFIVLPKQDSMAFYVIFEILSALGIVVFQIGYSSFYNTQTKTILNFLTGLYLWMSLISVLDWVFYEFSSSLLGGVIILGILLFLLFYSLPNSRNSLILYGEMKAIEYKEKEAIESIIGSVEIKDMAIKEDRSNDFLLAAYIRAHTLYCVSHVCYSRRLCESSKLNTKKFRGEMITGLLFNINRKFKNLLMLNNYNVPIRILYTSFLFYHMKNYILSWEINEGTSRCKLNVIQKLHVFCFKKKLKEIARTSKGKILNNIEPLEVTLRNKDSGKICRLIEQNGTAYGQFWDTLLERNPSYERFVALGFTFLQINKRIRSMWKKVASSKGSVPAKLIALYAMYAEEILQDDKKTREIKEYYETPELLIQGDMISQYMGSGNGVIGVSANARDLGKIKHFNSAICELSGYTKEELRDSSLSILIPKIFQEYHAFGFEEECFLVEGGEGNNQTLKDTFLLHKSQHIVSVTVQIATLPNFTNTYCFIAKVKKNPIAFNHDTFHIIADTNKIICCISSNAALFLKTTINVIRSTPINMSDILPEIHKVPEHVSAKMILYIPEISLNEGELSTTNTPATNKDPGTSIKTKSLFKISQTQSLNVTCEWSQIKLKSGKVVGYRYLITNSQMSYLAFPSPKHKESSYECNYNLQQNGYIIARNHRPNPSKRMTMKLDELIGRRVIVEEVVTKSLMRENDEKIQALPEFYKRFINQTEKICEQTGDFTLYNYILEQRNYGKGITTMRYYKGEFSEVKPSGLLLIEDSSLIEVEPSRDPSYAANIKRNAIMIQSAIKNKANIKRLIKTLTVPGIFWKLLLVCLFVALITISMILAIYLIFSDLFTTIDKQIKYIPSQFDVTRSLLEAASHTLQLVAVNQGLLSLTFAYPTVKSVDELISWTSNELKLSNSDLKHNLEHIKNIPFPFLTDSIYKQNLTYSYNETNSVFTDVTVMQAHDMIVEEVMKISQYTKLSQYKYDSPEIASLVYNMLNDMFDYMRKNMASFINTVDSLYYDQVGTAKNIIIVLCCIFASLILIQTPSSYYLNSVVFSQVDIFLKMPGSTCAKLVKVANDFVNKIHKREFELEEASYYQEEGDDNRKENKEENQNRPQGYGEENKCFYKNIRIRISYLWRILISLIVSLIVIVVMCITAFAHAEFMHDMLELNNSTVRTNIIGGICDFFYRAHFINSSAVVTRVNTTLQQAIFYDSRLYSNIGSIRDATEKIMNKFSSETKRKFTGFLYNTMCISKDSIFCSDPVALKGFFLVMSELLWLHKYLRHKYINDTNKYTVFNTSEYRRSVTLYHDYIQPGVDYLYELSLQDLVSHQTSTDVILQGDLIVVILFSLFCFFIMWIPYIQDKEQELIKLRLLLMFIPTKIIGKVKVFREYFAGILYKQNN